MKNNKYLLDKYFFRCIYFIRYRKDLPIKIGFATSLHSRLKEINTYAPYSIELIRAIRGNKGLEKKIHRLFKKYNTNGEWFEAVPKLLEFIDKCPKDNTSALEKHINSFKLEDNWLQF